MSGRWDLGRYGLERGCTCRSRSAECPVGWHLVDTGEDAAAMTLEARDLRSRNGVAYRVVERATGFVVG